MKKNVLSLLSPQVFGSSCTWAHMKCMNCHKYIVVITVHDFVIYKYYAHVASARFENFVCHGSLLTAYKLILVYPLMFLKYS